MRKEEAIARIKDHINVHKYREQGAVKMLEALEMALKALENPEPCEDAVSREAVEMWSGSETVDANPYHYDGHQIFARYMKNKYISGFGKWQWANGYNTALTALNVFLDKLPSVTPKRRPGKWIPCSEGLPEEDGGYLITCGIFNQRVVAVAHWNKKFWSVKSDIHAWMPLPDPYRGEGDS